MQMHPLTKRFIFWSFFFCLGLQENSDLKLRCDYQFMHASTVLGCVLKVEISKRCSFQSIEKFLSKTQNSPANLKLANVTATQNLGQHL